MTAGPTTINAALEQLRVPPGSAACPPWCEPYGCHQSPAAAEHSRVFGIHDADDKDIVIVMRADSPNLVGGWSAGPVTINISKPTNCPVQDVLGLTPRQAWALSDLLFTGGEFRLAQMLKDAVALAAPELFTRDEEDPS